MKKRILLAMFAAAVGLGSWAMSDGSAKAYTDVWGNWVGLNQLGTCAQNGHQGTIRQASSSEVNLNVSSGDSVRGEVKCSSGGQRFTPWYDSFHRWECPYGSPIYATSNRAYRCQVRFN